MNLPSKINNYEDPMYAGDAMAAMFGALKTVKLRAPITTSLAFELLQRRPLLPMPNRHPLKKLLVPLKSLPNGSLITMTSTKMSSIIFYVKPWLLKLTMVQLS